MENIKHKIKINNLFAILLVIFVISLFYPRPVFTPRPSAPEIKPQISYKSEVSPQPADNLVSIVNIYRLSKGLKPFVYDQDLALGAQRRAKYLIENNQWNHDGFVAQFHKVGFYVGAENLARNFTSDADIVEAWSLSKTHAEMMFSNVYHFAGVGRYGNLVVLWMWEGR